jgi:hypothetical protein
MVICMMCQLTSRPDGFDVDGESNEDVLGLSMHRMLVYNDRSADLLREPALCIKRMVAVVS